MKNNISTLPGKIKSWKKTTKFLFAVFLLSAVSFSILSVLAFSDWYFNHRTSRTKSEQSVVQKSKSDISQGTPVKSEITYPQEQQPLYGTFEIDGNSMAPYGFKNGNTATERLTNSCEVGDICDFLCLAVRCKQYQNKNTFKNVVKKDGDRYWFEGRYDKYDIYTKKVKKKKETITTEYWQTSFDSTDYGWMTNNKDIIIKGVVIKN